MRVNLKQLFRRLFKNSAEEEERVDKEAQFLSMLLPIGVVLIICAGIVAAFYYFQPAEKIDEAAEDSAGNEPIIETSRLDGTEIELGSANDVPWAIMVENHWESRPPSGLSKASIIFEAPTEAGITRFMAVYNSSAEADKIGPVRSARDYYLDWASEFNAIYAHVGGSPQALEKIPSANIYDLNQFFNGRYFWRSTDRYAPHNVYTNSELLREAMNNKGISEPVEFDSWRFKDERVPEQPGPTTVKINFSVPEYAVRWEWTSSTNEYIRYNDGEAHTEQDGTRLTAKNIAVVLTEAYVIDREGRLKLRTLGKGKAWVFRDGELAEATWSKPNPESRIKFYDVTGREILFNRGATWVEVITNRWGLKWE